MDLKTYLKLADDMELVSARVYDAETGNQVFTHGVNVKKTADSNYDAGKEFIKKLKNFFELCPGTYNIISRRHGAPDEWAVKHLVSNTNREVVGPSAPSLPAFDEKKLRESILSEIRAQEEIKAKEEKIKELRGEVEKFKTTGGKLEYIVSLFVERIMGAAISRKTALAGTEPQGQAPEVLQQAVETLLKYFTPEDLARIAARIDADPGLVNTINTFIK